MFHFLDENNVHFVYSPQLELTAYDYSILDAKKSFNIILADFLDYTSNKKSLSKLLKQMRWQIKDDSRNLKKILPPSIYTLIKDNDYISEIMDNYQVNIFYKNISLPFIDYAI